METLTLDKALELYEIIGKYIPTNENVDALEFIGKIVRNIKESNYHRDYVDAVMLMSNIPWEELKKLNSDEVLDLFIHGMRVNKIINLKTFCDQIGFGNA